MNLEPDREAKSSHLTGLRLSLLAILLVAGWLRFAGVDWDQGVHLHPDERFLTQVLTAIRPTLSIGDYFTTATSPLSPYNRGYGFFVYGTLPIFIVRYIAEGLDVVCQYSAWCSFPFTAYDGVHLVGRALSAAADLGTVAAIFWLGRALYNDRVGLLAACLGGAVVFQIQQAHFFTVDAFLTLFVTLAIYQAVRVAQMGTRRHWVLFGVFFGMAVASKISVWPLGLVLAAAALVRLVRDRRDVVTPYLGLLGAAGITLLVFRVGQPYAFAGPSFSPETLGVERFAAAQAGAPGWWGTACEILPEPLRALVLPSPEWLGNMKVIQSQMTGDVDFPPNHQWTDRKPLIFPLTNMVVYGMGPLLGSAAWIGWALALGLALLALWRIRAARDGAVEHLIPGLLVLWSGLFMMYQGVQWVKSMRYLLPIYPPLVVLASWLLVQLWNWARSRRGGSLGLIRLLAAGASICVVLGTYVWAFAFTGIYREPTTRLQATRWIFDNVPTGATILYRSESGRGEVQVPLRKFDYTQDGMTNPAPFKLPEDGRIEMVRMNYLSDPDGDAGSETFRVAIAQSPMETDELVGTSRVLALQNATHVRGSQVDFEIPPAQLTGGTDYWLITTMVEGAPVQSTGSLLVNESSWDDGLPLRADGIDGFSMYEGGTLELYWEDRPGDSATMEESKPSRMVRLLDEADYLVISSSRQIGSIPRLPPRYPLTIAYYEALFDGRLGFDLAASFAGNIHAGPIYINDVYGAVAWGESPVVGWPPPGEWAAEEAFSVYDHPPVWIFEKRPDYAPSQTRAILEGVDLSQQRFVTPYEYTEELRAGRLPWPLNLLETGASGQDDSGLAAQQSMWLSEEELAEQRQGGTWRDMFDPDTLINSSNLLAATAWWMTVSALGWLVFPIASVAFGGLPSKGYLISRTLGLLLVAWLVWVAVSLGLSAYTRSVIVSVVAAVACSGVAVGWRERKRLGRFLHESWRVIACSEVLAVCLFCLSLLIRSGNPDLWHPTFGGEKPMEFAFLNAVIKSTTFPPYDPWLAGAYVNYYYFGYVLLGNLIKLLAILPEVGFNLSLSMLFALTGLGAFSVSYDLVAGASLRRAVDRLRPHLVTGWRKAASAGVAAAIAVVLLGNLGQVATVLKGWEKLGASGPDKDAGLLVRVGSGALANLRGERIPIYTGSWYWDATRIIPPGEGEAGPITEFPFFTYLYADLHPHMIDMPIVLMALAWGLGVAQQANKDRDGRKGWRWLLGHRAPRLAAAWGMGALIVGSLRAINTWDWPALLGVCIVSVVYWAWRRSRSLLSAEWLARFALGASVLVGFSTVAFLPYTQRFVPAYTQVMLWEGAVTPPWAYLAVHGLFLFLLATVLVQEYACWRRQLGFERLAALEKWAPAIGIAALGVVGVMAVFLKLGIPIGPPVILLAVLAGLLALRSQLPLEHRAVLMLFTLGLTMSLAVELIVLSGDISRMNTVFKFYMQVWLIYGAVGGAALVWGLDWIKRQRSWIRQSWLTGLATLTVAAALYPPTAARAKIEDRFHADQPAAGLNGMTYMLTATHYDKDHEIPLVYDHEAIVWLREHVQGSPVIMEANTFPKIYGWGNRISIYTGLPSVVGWEWHTRQHRAGFEGATEIVRSRANDVIAFYNSPDVYQAQSILQSYDVRYAIVGGLERAYYSPVGLDKFGLMVELGMLEEAYRNEGTVIYAVEAAE